MTRKDNILIGIIVFVLLLCMFACNKSSHDNKTDSIKFLRVNANDYTTDVVLVRIDTVYVHDTVWKYFNNYQHK
jgi:hypothetical protein